MARQLIDNYAVMQHIPEIMGLSGLKWARNAWEGAYYINGERHAWKRDKLKVKVWRSSRGCSIWVHEQGGESLSLQNWLCRYGGAADWKEAMNIMRGNSTPCRELLEYVRPVEGKYVPESEWAKCNEIAIERCALFNWMCRLFPYAKVVDAWRKYGVTSDERGNCVYWYRDIDGNILHDKRMSYQWNGHRDKRFGAWRKFTTADGYTNRGLFGAHLITDDVEETISVVEAEKSAILGSLFFGGIWVSVGGKSALRSLENDPRMILYPDIDAIEEWTDKGKVAQWWMDEDAEGLGDHADIGDLIVKKVMKFGQFG